MILLHPERPCSQLQLGILAASLANLRVTNPRDGFDLRMPLRLSPLIGADAFTKPNSWRSRRWRVPLELAREAQPYPAGWDGLAALLAGEPQRLFTGAEIAQMAGRTIAATLTGAAADDFWRANR
ncbi:hypothetical protein [Sphingomonas aracearum]|nr:hypothetical protein [Sphingomonas aracearum]